MHNLKIIYCEIRALYLYINSILIRGNYNYLMSAFSLVKGHPKSQLVKQNLS